MTQQNESLSAFVDGEIEEQALVDTLVSDKVMADKWKRYHLIRSSLRNELPQHVDLELGDRINQALEQEPTILAPKSSWRSIPGVSQVIPLFKQGGQFAVAASFAAAMIVGVQHFNAPEAQEPFSVAPPFNIPAQGGLSPVSLQQTPTSVRPAISDQRRRVSALLSDHNQQVRLKHSHQIADEEKPENSVESDQK